MRIAWANWPNASTVYKGQKLKNDPLSLRGFSLDGHFSHDQAFSDITSLGTISSNQPRHLININDDSNFPSYLSPGDPLIVGRMRDLSLIHI